MAGHSGSPAGSHPSPGFPRSPFPRAIRDPPHFRVIRALRVARPFHFATMISF